MQQFILGTKLEIGAVYRILDTVGGDEKKVNWEYYVIPTAKQEVGYTVKLIKTVTDKVLFGRRLQYNLDILYEKAKIEDYIADMI